MLFLLIQDLILDKNVSTFLNYYYFDFVVSFQAKASCRASECALQQQIHVGDKCDLILIKAIIVYINILPQTRQKRYDNNKFIKL